MIISIIKLKKTQKKYTFQNLLKNYNKNKYLLLISFEGYTISIIYHTEKDLLSFLSRISDMTS
jgi:hypothetical protein